jgi:hypothetical protein
VAHAVLLEFVLRPTGWAGPRLQVMIVDHVHAPITALLERFVAALFEARGASMTQMLVADVCE